MNRSRAITARKIFYEGRFRDGLALVISDDTIERVGPADQLGPLPIEDWGDVALIPGTVNAHGHAFQNLFKGIADDLAFESWRDDVLYPLSAELDDDSLYIGALFAFTEALLAGVTTTVDFFYLNDGSNDNAEVVIRAAKDAGIRLVLARTFYDKDAPTQAPGRYREAAADAARRTRELAEGHSDDELISVQPAPHSLHACAPATLALARDVSRDLGVPWHLHLAEARYEIDLVAERHGTTPVRLLAREGLLDERLVAIHAVWLDDEELDLLAETGVGVVHCPGANAFLGDGVARLDEMLRRGIRVGLGPDGGCANNRQSVFDEMRLASLFVKARLNDGAALSAQDAFRLGTVAGAELLALPVGELASGRKADVVAVDLDDPSVMPERNLERHLVNSMQSTAIARVMVAGQVVVDAGRTTKVDRADLRRRLDEVTDGWTRPGGPRLGTNLP
ncbi:MAG TPA: amidohydrolase family protein [Actinomycetota bacterium]|nr:amidohydrolase family protein [Actinomycetota bacterium]